MTFAEELKNISDVVNFEVNMATECAVIKDMMREAASLGIRSFQIDIVKVFPGKDYDRPMQADNYYVIMVKGNHCNDDYKKKLFEFLQQQGFHRNEIDVATITNSSGCCTDITVRW